MLSTQVQQEAVLAVVAVGAHGALEALVLGALRVDVAVETLAPVVLTATARTDVRWTLAGFVGGLHATLHCQVEGHRVWNGKGL